MQHDQRRRLRSRALRCTMQKMQSPIAALRVATSDNFSHLVADMTNQQANTPLLFCENPLLPRTALGRVVWKPTMTSRNFSAANKLA